MFVFKNVFKEVCFKIKDLLEVEVCIYIGEVIVVIVVIGGEDVVFDNVLIWFDVDDLEVYLVYFLCFDLDGDVVFFCVIGVLVDFVDVYCVVVESGIQSCVVIINLFKDLFNWGSDDQVYLQECFLFMVCFFCLLGLDMFQVYFVLDLSYVSNDLGECIWELECVFDSFDF